MVFLYMAPENGNAAGGGTQAAQALIVADLAGSSTICESFSFALVSIPT